MRPNRRNYGSHCHRHRQLQKKSPILVVPISIFSGETSAEYNGNFEEALEAYEKASLCDPKAEYIQEKIPMLLIELGKNDEATNWIEQYLTQHPEKSVLRFMLARLKINVGKDDEAITLYEELLADEPDNSTIRLRLGLLYAKKGASDIAERLFSEVIDNDNNSYFAHLYLARLYSNKGLAEKAEKAYTKAAEINWSKELLFEMAEFYNIDRQFDKARNLYREILEKDEKDERAALGMVQTYLFLQNGEAALDELERIRDFSKNPAKINLVRAQILINIGESDRAKQVLEDILKDADIDQAKYLLGLILYQELNFDAALSVLRKIAPLSYEFKSASILQVRILEESLRHDEATAYLRKLLAAEESRLPVFYSLLSSLLLNNDKDQKALDVLAEGHKTFPQNETLLYEYAILLEQKKRHKDAMKRMQQLLLLNPNHADALNFVGYSWADDNIHLQKALDYITRALELKPNSGYIHDSLGWVYYRLGDYEKALKELDTATQLQEDDPHIYEHLGDTYWKLNAPERAADAYRKALEKLEDQNKIQSIEKKLNIILQ